jgi:hypothetical protein
MFLSRWRSLPEVIDRLFLGDPIGCEIGQANDRSHEGAIGGVLDKDLILHSRDLR